MSAVPPLRVGLIGCGRIALPVHLRVLRALAGVQLVALAEPDAARRAAAQRRVPAAAAHADYRDLLASPDLDAVVICVPNGMHAEVAVAALRRRKHVYLEKPLATDLAAGQRVLSAWRDAGVVGMIGFNFRRTPLYVAASRHIQTGTLGEILSVRSIYSGYLHARPDWQHARATGGGALLQLGSHHVDLVRFLLGQEIAAVSAVIRSYRTEGDAAAVQMRLADGTPVQSFFALYGGDEDRFEIYGRTGKLTVDRYLSLDVDIVGTTKRLSRLGRIGRGLLALRRSPHVVAKLRAPGRDPSYRSALRAFAQAASAGRQIRPDLQDGYQSLAVIDAAQRSAQTGEMLAVVSS